MKIASVLLLVSFLGVSVAFPKTTKYQFRNLYKDLGPKAEHTPSERIIGGNVAEPHSIPYQVFMEVHSMFQGWYCGGSLITPNFVLTAGHCGYGASRADLVLGAQKPQETESTQIRVTSTWIKCHEKFDMDNILNDIALIKLPKSVELNEYVSVVKLPSISDMSNTFVGKTARVSGWGVTRGNGNIISDVLRYVENPILSNSECSKQFDSRVEDNQVCMSGAGGKSSCNGDSGGPLTVDGVLVGIVSYGIRFCPAGKPSAYTRTTSFLSWIEANSDVV